MKPRVIVNCAMSADGKIASRDRKQVRISDDDDMKRVHILRSECDAILVGIGTVLADDPRLTAKEKYAPSPKNPLRVILDPHGKTPPGSKVLDGSAETLIVTCGKGPGVPGAEVLVCPCGEGRIDLEKMLAELGNRGVSKLMVEGGGETIWSFFEKGLVDEFRVFVGNMVIGGSGSPTPADGAGFPEEKFGRLALKKVTETGGGVILEYEVL